MTQPSPPAPSAGTYRPAVITFLDILGFREIVETRPPDEVRQILSLLRNFASSDEAEAVDHEHTRSISFSDSVIRIRHFDTDYPAGALFQEILSLVHAQTELIAKGVIVRGGVTVGNIVADGDDLFGPGFNRAYELESKIAVFPRILLGAEAIEALSADVRLTSAHHDLKDEVESLDQLLIEGGDGHYYVDYLRAGFYELDEPETYPVLLANHRRLIIERATPNAGRPKVLAKYLWLACYHNGICRMDGYQNLVITEADIPGLDAWARKRSKAPVKVRRRRRKAEF